MEMTTSKHQIFVKSLEATRFLLCAGFLSIPAVGCAGAWNTGVTRLDDNLYMTSRQDMAESSGSRVKIVVYQEAVNFCQSMGKKVEVVSTSQSDNSTDKCCASAEVQFRCM
jgi:hypothetical protein